MDITIAAAAAASDRRQRSPICSMSTYIRQQLRVLNARKMTFYCHDPSQNLKLAIGSVGQSKKQKKGLQLQRSRSKLNWKYPIVGIFSWRNDIKKREWPTQSFFKEPKKKDSEIWKVCCPPRPRIFRSLLFLTQTFLGNTFLPYLFLREARPRRFL